MLKTIKLSTLNRVLTIVVCALILRVTAAIVWVYRDYVPPNFESDFLAGREGYFFNGYHWAFYSHIASGPVSLVVGLILLSDRFRVRFPGWHRILGRVQAVCVLLFLSPSGLWMAWHAESGWVAGLGFGTLAVLTGLSVAMGWKYAVQRQFVQHRRWMERCYVLLCSAVVLRIIGGIGIVTNVDSSLVYPASAWVSWLLPLGVCELVQRAQERDVAGVNRGEA